MIQLPLYFEAAPPVAPAAKGSARHIALPGGPLHYTLVRARRRTLSIIVGGHGVTVRAPRWLPLPEVEAFMREKESWIRRRMNESRHEIRPFAWSDGECLPLFGRPVRLRAVLQAAAPQKRKVLQDGDCLVARLQARDGPEQLRSEVLAWLRTTALELFLRRVAHFSQRLNVPGPAVGLSNARTQWGSCRATGRVLLNWRLVHMPERLIDYVVAHEIAHLREMNHSPRFWALVESVYPDCRAARRELNVLARQLPNL